MLKKLALVIIGLVMLPLGVALANEDSGTNEWSGKNFQEKRQEAQERRQKNHEKLESKRLEHEQKKNDLKQKAESAKDNACKRRISKLENRVANVDKRKKGLLTHYQKAEEHMQRLIDRGKTAGADTAELEADLVEYKTMVDNLAADFDAFVEAINQGQTLDCAEPKEQLKTLHKAIQAAHQKVVADRKAIHNYYKETIRPDAITLIKAINQAKTTDSETNGAGETQ